MLLERLEVVVFQAFQTVGDSLHEVGLCELLKPGAVDTNKDDAKLPEGEAAPAGSGAAPAGGGRGGGRSIAARAKLMETLRAMEAGNAGTTEGDTAGV